jgi:hypothetical protein
MEQGNHLTVRDCNLQSVDLIGLKKLPREIQDQIFVKFVGLPKIGRPPSIWQARNWKDLINALTNIIEPKPTTPLFLHFDILPYETFIELKHEMRLRKFLKQEPNALLLVQQARQFLAKKNASQDLFKEGCKIINILKNRKYIKNPARLAWATCPNQTRGNYRNNLFTDVIKRTVKIGSTIIAYRLTNQNY